MSGSLPQTERVNEATHDLDLLDSPALVAVFARENAAAVGAVDRCSAEIARAVDGIVGRLRRGGTLHYVGAGTSGRLGFLDAAECPPTFGTPPELVRAHIAGGPDALVRAVEGAEDDADAGRRLAETEFGASDAVVGLSASGGAPYVVAAIESARRLGALTVGVTNASGTALEKAAEIPIVLATGPEAISGSTRLKAGTAQKLVLNALSSATMIRLGKVYDNLMVDVVATNAKLRRRALRLVTALTACDEARGAELLRQAGSVKVAVVMQHRNVSADVARAILAEHAQSLRAALA